MGVPRFFAPDATGTSALVALPEDEAAHLTRVLRLGPGAEIRVFDGRGAEWSAIVDRADKRSVSVRLHAPVAPAAEPRVALTLAMAVLKGEKMDAVVRDSVMLGVAAIQPIVTTRTEIGLAALARGERLDRWRRIAIASAKQCGRAVVPAIASPLPFEAALDEAAGALMFVEPGAAVVARALGDLPPAGRAVVFVGPEGGWSGDELGRAVSAGVTLVTLGTQTLRADAMPIVALAALRARWGDL